MRSIILILNICLLNFFCLALPTMEERILFESKEIKVVGGSSASNGQFPYIASLRRYSYHFCAATIISSTYLLSAAHCTVGTSTSSITAVVGTSTLNSGGTFYSINTIVNHSSYNSSAIVNDISLLKTVNEVIGSTLVASIPISSSILGAGFSVTLCGWGRTLSGDGLPNDLQFINLETIDNTDCAQRQSPNPIFTTSLCTFTRSGEGACNGDSGGPLVYDGILVGIVSWGRPCAIGYPDVFTRVSSYVSWIQSIAI